MQGWSEMFKRGQAWKLALDGLNLARGHEVPLSPSVRIRHQPSRKDEKSFILRFNPLQHSLWDHGYL